jgi:hypothetical protein
MANIYSSKNNLQHLRWNVIVIIIIIMQCFGCASISRGVTEAFLGDEDEEQVDERECSIRGSTFQGVQSYLDRQKQFSSKYSNSAKQPTLKVLMVHGIGKHLQGYSTQLAENLATALGLDVAEARFKEIEITSPVFPDQDIGTLRVHRYTNKTEKQELLFHELTWSPITEKEKEIIAYDDSGEHTFRRANINNMMKGFMNSHVSDPLIYLGESQEKIQLAVGQSFCWMLSRDWLALDENTQEHCEVDDTSYLTETDDDYVFITHSMGSRIVTDSLQRIVELIEDEFQTSSNEHLRATAKVLQNKQIPVFMLANQLPLLQLGRKLPEVNNQFDSYCTNNGTDYDERFFKELTVVAFSDPNDILSYIVPPKFIDEYMDSRLCTNLVNVIINVAEVVDLFGLGALASPLEAHSGYDNDERVIRLISQGIGNQHTAPVIKERCTWLETR